MQKTGFWSLLILLILLAAGCTAAPVSPTPTLVMPTAVPPTPIVPPLAAAPSPTPPPPPPTAVTEPVSASTATPVATTVPPTPTPRPVTYQVAFVTNDDTLNVRSGPGVNFAVVGELDPQAAGVQITGDGRMVDGSTWVPVTAGSLRGWVNSRFLTADLPEADFCNDQAVVTLVAELKTAVSNRDNTLLGQLIHPERGLRLHTYWWNPVVLISGEEIQRLFTSRTTYDWGIEDGSGFPIFGSFARVVLPDLERDLLPATEEGCNKILHGATAGLVRLPDGYEQVPFVSLYRSAGDEIEFDWGTWVIGVEWWNGRYYLSYLVHFGYEI